MHKITPLLSVLAALASPAVWAATSANLILRADQGTALVDKIDNRVLTLDTTGAVTLVVNAPGPLDPSKVAASIDGNPLTSTAQGAQVTYSITANQVTGAGVLALTYEGRGVATLAVKKLGSSNESSAKSELTVEELLTQDCSSAYSSSVARKVGNTIQLDVLPNGNVLWGYPAAIDENDTVVVRVYAHKSLLPFLKVRRSSAIRAVGNVNILGAGLTIPGFKQFAAGESPCSYSDVELRDFAPGKGEIELSVVVSGKTVVTGTIEFTVHALYTGMFSLGAIWSNVQDPQYSLTDGPGGKLITATEKGDRRLLYTLLYTPFIWGSRDIEVSNPLWHHINPTLGLVLNSPFEHGLAGVSIDFFDGFVVTGGLHVSHVSVVNTDSGLAIGSPLPEGVTAIPNAKQWKQGFFWGASVDLRAAVQFIQTVLTARESK